MIDMNTPWRIVADLDSEIMRQHSVLYGYGNAESVLSNLYTTAYSHHYRSFVEDILGVYNRVRAKAYSKPYVRA